MAGEVSIRSCDRCGGTLSRYNRAETCSACSDVDSLVTAAAKAAVPLEHCGGDAPADGAGQILRAWRIANQRSQAEVAAALGVTQQHLSLLENGRRPVSLDQRRRIVAELGVAPEDLGLATVAPQRSRPDGDAKVTASQMEWRAQRRWLNQHRSVLARQAAQLYPEDVRLPRSPIIAAPAWLLDRPVDLASVAIHLDERPQTTVLDGSEYESCATRPLRSAGARFDRYTSAIRQLDPPHLFESRPSYRLLGGGPAAGRLDFGMAAYFDKLDISEAVGHELAAACMDSGGVPRSLVELAGRLPFRDLIGDPFDTRRRAVIPAITTLTIRLRRYPAAPSFLLHWRDPARVATAAGIYDVIPAGEFQPSSVALWDRRADFDLWRNVVREYSEELLGTPEHDGTRTQPIDYDNWPLFQRLQQALAEGTARASVLGMGLDALTLAATILTVVVLDDDVFCAAFGEAVRFNDEGEIVAVAGGTPTDGVPFTEEFVARMLDSEPMASPGAACLALAWQHRGELLGL
jgi:transcriptional regulator with XRE-family HTH domain